MKLTYLHIQNFRSCKDISLQIGKMHALVGGNNAGKSTVLRALDFLFNPTAKALNEEAFWNKDTSLEIRVEAIFTELTDSERAELSAYLKPDDSFHIARYAKMGAKGGDSDTESDSGDDKIGIGQQYKKPIPEPQWLQDSQISGKNIAEWWKTKDKLTVDGVVFGANATKKPTVEEWKELAKAFVEANAQKIPMTDEWVDNPKGYAGVLKGTLPFFVLVPAVRDVMEESKGTKSSPFGKLLYAILDSVTGEKKAEIEEMLGKIAGQMNRSGGIERMPHIAEAEKRMNKLLEDFFMGCDLEIEFEAPTLEVILTTPKIYVDDGFRNVVENKGHGLQRAVIFTILRRYAEYMTSESDEKRRTLILAVEEPELYMHPQAQRTIRRVFRKISDGDDQVLFSTHSSLLVDVGYFDEIVRMETATEKVSGKKQITSTAWQLPINRVIEDLEERCPNLKGKVTENSIRDKYSHAYNPRRNEGFFASRIILVEGLTEEYSLPIYADAVDDCAFDPRGISVVECGGKLAMDRLYQIFNELHIPCYLLFDYDTGNSNKTIVAKSKEILEFIGETETDAPKALRVSDTFACFVKKWETDLSDEISDVNDWTAKARKELGLNDDSGKPLIARYIARGLTAADPPQVPESIRKIIQKAVEVEWSKSCLKKKAAQSP